VSCTTLHPGFVASEIAQVDNEGAFHPEKVDRRPRALMWPTDRAARVMLDAIARRRREVVFTAHGKAAAWLGRHAPGLLHFAMSRTGSLG
jgi:short-subunit dehydrogenase